MSLALIEFGADIELRHFIIGDYGPHVDRFPDVGDGPGIICHDTAMGGFVQWDQVRDGWCLCRT